MRLAAISRRLSDEVDRLHFARPVAYVYNPLAYARRPHEAYLSRYGKSAKQVVFLGMNPGPFGMAQTGVPFGDPGFVRDWMGIDAPVDRPDPEHPKRRILGLASTRSEVSGTRLWGWAQDRFGSAEAFFARFFVANYCPLVFMEEGGRNLTPDKLPRSEAEPLEAACDLALRHLIEELRPEWVVGVGAFAEARANTALAGLDLKIGRILHPSPASPVANRGWAAAAERELSALGIELPPAP